MGKMVSWGMGVRQGAVQNGVPGGNRTPNPLLRRQVLYPVELRAHKAIL